MNYDEYVNFLDHLSLQWLVDFEYHERADVGSTVDALTILGGDDA